MRKAIVFLLLILPFLSNAQERGVGVRFGEPFSITYKDFISDYISFEGMIGSAGVNSSSYYQRDFENNPPDGNAFYRSNSVKKGVSINARLAYHEDFSEAFGIDKGYILGYAGAGAQFRTTNVTFTYTLDQIDPEQPGLQEERTNVDFGPEAFVGFEYYFDDLPLNIFAEGGIFIELLDRIGHMKGQGGIGVRYVF